ncbi:amidase signature domain-containing protein [Aspergillus stella-maris]|uniref:amidase signature domain-containing protein n=1 Tax=Aspergillus stella-maris TaxID=1810926 RepID=UPI003CCCF5F7
MTVTNLTPETWQAIAAKKREEVATKVSAERRLDIKYTEGVNETSTSSVLHIPGDCGLLSPTELDITEKYDAVALVEAIAAAKYTAEEVAVAFCKRAAIAQQLTACLTEIFFDEAIARAKELDEYFQKTGKTKGPFHGLPISVKDSFNVKGYETTVGFVSFIGKSTALANAPLIDILLELGAVLYVKTNIPQTMMTAESENNIFGRTLNPHNTSLTAGGSSGGAGALVAMRGSLLSVGTDIAGSIRIPALCCGTFGFRPTAGRIPYGGQLSGARNGSPGMVPCAGPLATTFRDMKFFMDAVMELNPWNRDPSALAVPWQQTLPAKGGPFTVGVVGEDSEYPFNPPVRRSLDAAVSALKSAGHTVKVLQDAPSISSAAMVAYKLCSLDPSHSALKHIEASGEPPIRSLHHSLPDFGDKEFTIDDVFDLNAQRAEFVAAWHQIWLENGLDAIIMPGHSKTAGPHDTYGVPPYTVIWNLIDWPACVIPYGKVDPSLDSADADFNPDIVQNAPCSIQIVGRKFHDEELLSTASVIATSLGA